MIFLSGMLLTNIKEFVTVYLHIGASKGSITNSKKEIQVDDIVYFAFMPRFLIIPSL